MKTGSHTWFHPQQVKLLKKKTQKNKTPKHTELHFLRQAVPRPSYSWLFSVSHHAPRYHPAFFGASPYQYPVGNSAHSKEFFLFCCCWQPCPVAKCPSKQSC